MANRETQFKSYDRGTRTQTSDESFASGMFFTRAPLDDKYVRMLINYDIIAEGEAIATRKGYRTTTVGLPFNTSGLQPTITDNISITQVRDAVEEDNNHYMLYVANKFDPDADELPNINLYKAPAELWVMENDYNDPNYQCLDEYDVECRNLYALPMSYEISETPPTTLPESYYHIPDNPEANGIPITQKNLLARPVGCFAWNNNYYNFNTDGDLLRSKYMPADGTSQATYIVEKLTPKDITASEVAANGVNMLRENPFVYTDSYQDGNIQLDGPLIYDNNDKLQIEPKINTEYKLRVYYKVKQNNKYKIVIDLKHTDTEAWETIDTIERTFNATDPEPLTTKIKSPYEKSTIRVQAFKYNGSSYETTAEKIIATGQEFVKAGSANIANRELIKYDLSKATGMLYWKNRLWLYGLAQDPTILFASDINEPTYFPYPNNIDIFDDPIMACTPFNENLLVFTRSKIFQITLDEEGYWTKKVIQSNLNFRDFDARFIQIVKNMMFFKSGDYYYMIVPKTLSLQNELAIAPISKNIEYFLDDFKENVDTIFEIMYNKTGVSYELVNHYNYLDYEDIHNVYEFKTVENLLVNLDLLYNTVDRTWRIYAYESEVPYYPIRQDATNTCEMIAPLKASFNISGTETTSAGVQILAQSRDKVKDFYIPQSSLFVYGTDEEHTEPYWKPDDGVIQEHFDQIHKYLNHQVLDTGYRAHHLDLNKRYRELQVKFNNVDDAPLRFGTEFIIDGETRINLFRYEVEHVLDPSAPNYGLIYISRTPVENMEIPGSTTLGDASSDINSWLLDSSRFPEVVYWKARMRVSGKGFAPRFRLVSRSEERYEILGYTWVYRTLYSR